MTLLSAGEPPSAPCGEERDLPGDQHLLRSVAHDTDNLEWFDDEKMWLPNSRGLQFDPDCSMFWREHLALVHSQGAPDVAVEKRPLVFEAKVDDLRDVDFGVTHSPQKDTPIDCAHSSVDWPGGKRPRSGLVRAELRGKMARRMALVHGELRIPPPPGA